MSIELTAITGAEVNTEKTQKAAQKTGTEFSDTLRAASKIDLDAIFKAAADKFGLPLNLLKSVAKAESNFRPEVTSKSGAMGIMQLMPGTAKSLGVTDAFDPEQNIMGGAKYLSQQLERFDGEIELALAAYNAGPGAVKKHGGIPPYKETQNYVKKIMGYISGEEITAGNTVSSKPAAPPAGSTPVVRKNEESSGADGVLKKSLTEMFMMKILEMQMKSSDEHKI